MLNDAIKEYNDAQTPIDRDICGILASEICRGLPQAENKVWHAHPVGFLEGNPIVGNSKPKAGIRLMFWSGADLGEKLLTPGTGKFKDASVFYNNVAEINFDDLKRWLKKAAEIQWDYKNIVKRKGVLERLK